MITTITGKNQITIPAKLAVQLNIQPGMRIDWSVNDDGVLIARPFLLVKRWRGAPPAWDAPG